MNVSPKRRLTVDEYLDWAQEHPGRYELYNGSVYAMSPEGIPHAKVKLAIQFALAGAIRSNRLACHVLPDGVTVRVDAKTAYEPDALVYCGPEIESGLEVPNPVIIVEVLSPSTRYIDTSFKLAGYFRLPSVAHYLIVDPLERFVLHHSRGSADEVIGHMIREGSITLDPPGLTITMDEIYGGA